MANKVVYITRARYIGFTQAAARSDHLLFGAPCINFLTYLLTYLLTYFAFFIRLQRFASTA